MDWDMYPVADPEILKGILFPIPLLLELKTKKGHNLQSNACDSR